MDITKDIQPMTTFRNHSAEIVKHLRQTQRPVILTVNGKPAAVIQDPAAYQRLLDLAAEVRAEEGNHQGEEDVSAGRTRDVKEVLDELTINLADSIHARFVKFGGVELPNIIREPISEPPDFYE